MKRLFFICILLISNYLNAQVLENLYDARSEALGRTLAILDGQTMLFGNPAAGLGQPKRFATLGAQSRFLITDIQLFHAGVAFAKKQQQFGISTQYVGNQYLKSATIGAQYARKLFEKLDAGVRLRGGQINADVYGSRLFFDADLGFQSSINSRLTIGALMQNLMRFSADRQDQAPTNIRLGAAYRPSKKVKMNMEIVQNIRQNLTFGVGVEYLPTESLSFRIGTRTRPAMPSFGLGYRIKERFTFDTFATYHPTLGISSGLNLSLDF